MLGQVGQLGAGHFVDLGDEELADLGGAQRRHVGFAERRDRRARHALDLRQVVGGNDGGHDCPPFIPPPACSVVLTMTSMGIPRYDAARILIPGSPKIGASAVPARSGGFPRIRPGGSADSAEVRSALPGGEGGDLSASQACLAEPSRGGNGFAPPWLPTDPFQADQAVTQEQVTVGTADPRNFAWTAGAANAVSCWKLSMAARLFD